MYLALAMSNEKARLFLLHLSIVICTIKTRLLIPGTLNLKVMIQETKRMEATILVARR